MYTKERIPVAEKENVQQMLAQKLFFLNEISNLNQSAILIGEESDVNEYVDLVEKRTVLFSKLKEIDENLRQYDLKAFSDDEQVNENRNRIKELVEEIIRFDMNFNLFVEKIYFNIKDKLREIGKEKSLTNASHAYTTVVDFEYGQYYDKKN